MAGLPSLEGLFSSAGQRDVSWSDDLGIEEVQDVDVFALVDVMDHGMDLEAGGVAVPQPHQSPEPGPQQQSKQTQRAERTRARNRLAQARYRQKAKV